MGTKAEVGHDENMTEAEVQQLIGKDMAQKAKEMALKLYQRGVELMRQKGLILIDTKYEFGLDEEGKLHVIDEVNTPDSSRLCNVEEWEEKYPKIANEMATGNYKTVSDVMKAKPELKIKEFSKQYVRDALLEMGFNPEKDKAVPKLSDEQVVECSYRYISIYERITGQQFEFPTTRIEPAKFKIPSQIRICSAHKQPGRLQAVLAHYDKSAEPMLIVGCAGGTDALSGTASYLSRHPVVSCPPDGMNQTCLTNPPGSSNAFIVKPSNVAKFAAQFFAHHCPEISKELDASIQDKIRKLEQADDTLVKRA